MNKRNVFIVCTGLGNINRGYETFTQECFNALSDNDYFELLLLKGGGANECNQFKIPNLRRQHKANILLSKLIRKEPYVIEQFTFLLGMIPSILKYKPAVIYYSDFILGTYLWHLRNLFNFKYKLLFSNGAPNEPPFTRMDHIQQLLPFYIYDSLKSGVKADMMSLLRYGFNFNNNPNFKSKIDVRKNLKLPLDKKIVISIGAINSYHKRMDYVVNEFSFLNQDEYFLILLGNIDSSSSVIFNLANSILPKDNYLIREVSSLKIFDYLLASDYFILGSMNEGLPRVLPEALFLGHIPIVHNYTVTKEVLCEYGIFKDLSQNNILESAISEVDMLLSTNLNPTNYAYLNYSWDSLRAKYIHLINSLLIN